MTEKSFLAWFKRNKPDAVISVNPDVVSWLRSTMANRNMPGQVGSALLNWHVHYGDIAGADQNDHLVGVAAVDILLGQLQRNERGLPADPNHLIKSSWRDSATVRSNSDQGSG